MFERLNNSVFSLRDEEDVKLIRKLSVLSNSTIEFRSDDNEEEKRTRAKEKSWS